MVRKISYHSNTFWLHRFLPSREIIIYRNQTFLFHVDANLASNKIQHLSISQLSSTPSSSVPMSKSMTVIHKNPHLSSYNPPKTTPIQITNHANLQTTSGLHNIPRNTSKFQQLKHNIWPSSLPSPALPSSPNSQHHEIPASTSSSNHFLSTLFSSIRSGNSQSTHKQDKKVNRSIKFPKNF